LDLTPCVSTVLTDNLAKAESQTSIVGVQDGTLTQYPPFDRSD